jgi:hypothetical protein
MSKLIRHICIVLFVMAIGYEATWGRLTALFRLKHLQGPSLTPFALMVTIKKALWVKGLRLRVTGISAGSLILQMNEATKFWPLYSQYQQELTAVRILKRLNNSTSSTNGTEQIDKEIYYESQLVGIRKRYRDSFAKILPPEKVSVSCTKASRSLTMNSSNNSANAAKERGIE